MLVILVGAIGGLLAAGILGLFIGPVVMALAYELLTAWLAEQPEVAGAVPTPAVPSGPGAIEGAGPKGVSNTGPV
jgi:predicted PurR-regulated permease PerM